MRALKATDKLAICWLMATAVLLLFADPTYSLINVLVTALILLLSNEHFKRLYPLGLILLLFLEVDMIAGLFYDQTYDSLVYSWDRWLFGTSPHEYLQAGALADEIFHLLYVSYYLILIAIFVHAVRVDDDKIPFVLLGSFLSFLAMFIAFPVAGPLIYPEYELISTGFFPALVSLLYQPALATGLFTGAFPSSHVGMSVIVVMLYGRYKIASILLVLGVAVSTAYGQFHYAIDALAGMIAGVGLYYLWTGIYGLSNTRNI